MHAQFGVPWVRVARSPVSQITEHEWDSPTAFTMPQEDLWTGRVNPPSVLSGLEPMDAHEGCVACGSPGQVSPPRG